MQDIDLIVTAFALGALGQQKAATNPEIIERYRQMKLKINEDYPGVDLTLLEDAPISKTVRFAVKDDLSNRGAGGDNILVDFAQKLLDLVRQLNPELLRELGVQDE